MCSKKSSKYISITKSKSNVSTYRSISIMSKYNNATMHGLEWSMYDMIWSFIFFIVL